MKCKTVWYLNGHDLEEKLNAPENEGYTIKGMTDEFVVLEQVATTEGCKEKGKFFETWVTSSGAWEMNKPDGMMRDVFEELKDAAEDLKKTEPIIHLMCERETEGYGSLCGLPYNTIKSTNELGTGSPSAVTCPHCRKILSTGIAPQKDIIIPLRQVEDPIKSTWIGGGIINGGGNKGSAILDVSLRTNGELFENGVEK